MTFPQLEQFTDIALLLLRVMVGIVFITSGWKHLRDPVARSKDIEMSKGFTICLGAAELAAGLVVMFGFIAQLAAIVLIVIMLGVKLSSVGPIFSRPSHDSGARRRFHRSLLRSHQQIQKRSPP